MATQQAIHGADESRISGLCAEEILMGVIISRNEVHHDGRSIL